MVLRGCLGIILSIDHWRCRVLGSLIAHPFLTHASTYELELTPRDIKCRDEPDHEDMEKDNLHHQSSGTACQCPMCSATPGPTYTRDYMMECLVRWYVKQPEQVQAEFVSARKRMFRNDDGFREMREAAERLGLTLNFF